MIANPISTSEVETKINAIRPTWLTRAGVLTRKFRKAGKYIDHTTIWSEIKEIYIKHQKEKCVFCERKMRSLDAGGSYEFDLEHFRPKSSIKSWPNNETRKLYGITPNIVPNNASEDVGYYLLAYHPLNYAASCKPCNSKFKSNYFPVFGTRNTGGTSPDLLISEKPLLIYPIGTWEDDPEDLIGFQNGVTAVPKHTSGDKFVRAYVTIAFFDLNNKEVFLKARAKTLAHLYQNLELVRRGSPEQRTLGQQWVDVLLHPASECTACAKAFSELYKSDLPRAHDIAKDLINYALET